MTCYSNNPTDCCSAFYNTTTGFPLKAENKKEKCDEYSNLFGPLTLNQAKGRTQEFQWTLQPWPWEGGCE